jgi:ribosomal-protein-alanine N-acetyltransferase
MTRRHLPQVLRIEEACFPRPWSPGLFLGELAQRQSRRYRVALAGRRVLGYLGLMVVADEGHVTTLAVDPAAWGRGVATRLLLDAAQAAPELGVEHLTLEVRVGNDRAQALYRRFGFAPVGIRRNYYTETNEDALVMWARDITSPEYRQRLAGIARELEASPPAGS